jgi:hypothetical protein
MHLNLNVIHKDDGRTAWIGPANSLVWSRDLITSVGTLQDGKMGL